MERSIHESKKSSQNQRIQGSQERNKIIQKNHGVLQEVNELELLHRKRKGKKPMNLKHCSLFDLIYC